MCAQRPIENDSQQRVCVSPASSIARHVLEHKHTADLTNFKVVHKAKNSKQLQFVEALVINRLKPSLCKQKELMVNLALPW